MFFIILRTIGSKNNKYSINDLTITIPKKHPTTIEMTMLPIAHPNIPLKPFVNIQYMITPKHPTDIEIIMLL